MLIPLAIAMNNINERLKTSIGYFHILEHCILLVIEGGVAIRQTRLNIRRYQKRSPIPQLGIKLGEIDVNARQVEVAEVDVTIGNSP